MTVLTASLSMPWLLFIHFGDYVHVSMLVVIGGLIVTVFILTIWKVLEILFSMPTTMTLIPNKWENLGLKVCPSSMNIIFALRDLHSIRCGLKSLHCMRYGLRFLYNLLFSAISNNLALIFNWSSTMSWVPSWRENINWTCHSGMIVLPSFPFVLFRMVSASFL